MWCAWFNDVVAVLFLVSEISISQSHVSKYTHKLSRSHQNHVKYCRHAQIWNHRIRYRSDCSSSHHQQQLVWYWEYKVVRLNHAQHHHHHHKWREWLSTRDISVDFWYYLEKKWAVILLQQEMCWIYVHCNGSLHSLLCVSLLCTLCKRGQPEDLSIPVQVWTLTHCLLAYMLCYFCTFVFVSSVALLVVYYFVCFHLSLFVYLTMICMNAVIRRLFDPLRRGHSYIIIFLTDGNQTNEKISITQDTITAPMLLLLIIPPHPQSLNPLVGSSDAVSSRLFHIQCIFVLSCIECILCCCIWSNICEIIRVPRNLTNWMLPNQILLCNNFRHILYRYQQWFPVYMSNELVCRCTYANTRAKTQTKTKHTSRYNKITFDTLLSFPMRWHESIISFIW